MKDSPIGWLELRGELLARAAEDQEVRRALTDAGLVDVTILPGHPRHGEFLEFVSRLSEVDQRNRQWFRERISDYGWPRGQRRGA